MLLKYLPILILLSVFAFMAVKAKKLTAIAGITGWAAGLLIFAGAGYSGVAMIAAFFISGTAATSHGITIKHNLNLAEKNKGRRTAGQVIANAGTASLLGLLVVLFPQKAALLQFMLAASIASATADTLSSELGNLYGKSFYNIVTLKKDTRGLDGVISIEGTLIGMAGSTIIAAIYAFGFKFNLQFFWIIVAGTIGNLSDSVLGATAERKGYLYNDLVNFLNTAIAALFALILFYL